LWLITDLIWLRNNSAIKLDNHCASTRPAMILIHPSIVTVVSIFFGAPLHIISAGDSPHVTAALSLGKLVNHWHYYNPYWHLVLYNSFSTVQGVLNEDAYLVTWSSNSQGDQFFNADQNNFYLAVDKDNNIVVLPGDVPDEVCK